MTLPGKAWVTFPSALECAEPKPTRVRDVAAAYDVILRTRHVYQPQESSVKPVHVDSSGNSVPWPEFRPSL